jgi:hypothetical protein
LRALFFLLPPDVTRCNDTLAIIHQTTEKKKKEEEEEEKST